MKIAARILGEGMAHADARVAELRRRAIEQLQRRIEEQRVAREGVPAPAPQSSFPRGSR